MNIAQGSIEECQYYLILSKDLGYGPNNELVDLLNEVSKMLDSYIKTLLSTNFYLLII
jgi:four helix bundle protein